MLNLKTLTAGAVGLSLMASAAFAEKVLRIQSVLPTTADEVVMLNAFGDDVFALTGGSLKIEVLPAGAVVGPRDIMDAVDAGLVEGGFAWTHYWGGKHVAANLFGAPVCGRWRWHGQHRIPILVPVRWRQRAVRPSVGRNGRERQRLHAAASWSRGPWLVPKANRIHG